MQSTPFLVVTDRGGHLHNAVMLLEQMQMAPRVLVTTYGPDVRAIRDFNFLKQAEVVPIPYLFSWIGKWRFLNPFKVSWQFFLTAFLALRLRPKHVVSLGATNVVFFCFWAWVFGAKIYHVECMNQVHTKSVTGRLLYPFCDRLYVQWEELRRLYGSKAEYAGWVLGGAA